MSETEERRLTWRLALWPVLVFVYVSAMVFVLAKAHPFSPAAPAVSSAPVTLGDAVQRRDRLPGVVRLVSRCGRAGGGIGPALAGSQPRPRPPSRRRSRPAAGRCRPNLVDGERLADVLAYIEQIAPQ